MSGLAALGPIRVESRSRDELRSYLVAKLDEEMPPDELRAIADTYSLMGLIPAGLDLRAVLISLYEEQVSGFYEPDSLTLFLLDDQAEALVDGILAHELVHALQDQWLGIDSLADPDIVGNDAAMAVHAALEGHATFVMIEQMLSGTGRTLDPSMVAGMLGQMRNQATANVEGSPALAAAPRIIRDPMIMAYLEGLAYVTRVWGERGRDHPIGEFLPPSTERVLGGAPDDEPVGLEITVTGGSIVDEDGLGRLELGIFAEEIVGDGWDVLANGWGGDRYVLVETMGGVRGLVWWLVWDHADNRDAFAEAVSESLDGLGASATLESTELDGLPAVVLRIGGLDGVEGRARLVAGVRSAGGSRTEGCEPGRARIGSSTP